MNKVLEGWYSQDELRQFIELAMKWPINKVYKGITGDSPYYIFAIYIHNAEPKFKSFQNQLRDRLADSVNLEPIEIDVKSQFLPMIDRYVKWYSDNKIALEKFYPSNPYMEMLDVIERTKKEILKYFPDKVSSHKMNCPAKYYALYHWILIELGIENDFKRDDNDKYRRKQIEAFAGERYPGISKQGFYRSYIEIDITNKTAIANSFSPEYKTIIIKISGNSANIITHLKEFPNH